jgi:hypothetical protein
MSARIKSCPAAPTNTFRDGRGMAHARSATAAEGRPDRAPLIFLVQALARQAAREAFAACRHDTASEANAGGDACCHAPSAGGDGTGHGG